MEKETTDKFKKLLSVIKGYGTVSVGYSGGIDSTLLVFAACKALGPDNVVIYQITSELIATKNSYDASTVIGTLYGTSVRYKQINIAMLDSNAVTKNNENRCYECKKKMYSTMIAANRKESVQVLIDGTNIDDLEENRPGMKAINELGVKTPFVSCNINKSEIRKIAAEIGLPNASLPSDSCLATRIAAGRHLDKRSLRFIEKTEQYFGDLGFRDFRVRPRDTFVIIELCKNDFNKCLDKNTRMKIITYFQEHGFAKVMLDLAQRS